MSDAQKSNLVPFAWRVSFQAYPMNTSTIDRSVFSVGTLGDEPDDLAYWLRQTPAERLAGIEFLRRQFYAYGKARPEFRRLLEIAELPRR